MLKKKNIKATEDFALNKSKEQMELKTRQKAKASVNAQSSFLKRVILCITYVASWEKDNLALSVCASGCQLNSMDSSKGKPLARIYRLAEKPNFDQNGVRIIYFNLKVNWLWKVNDLYCYWTVNDLLTLNFLGRLNDSGNFHLFFSLRGKMYWLAGNVGHFKVFLARFRLLVPCESKQHKLTSRKL